MANEKDGDEGKRDEPEGKRTTLIRVDNGVYLRLRNMAMQGV